ncbi:hypothetical protein [Chryseobacterium sp.]|uniref:hypothetical protein n=1 Tax=Chryseobacterium sp. TaxID=1871047 RepID=UPI00289E2D05|nr:hypothetical protein [Chryseobacterium sp.]
MKKLITIAISLYFICFLNSCGTTANTSEKSEMTKNAEALQKKQDATKIEIDWNNNYGKPGK